MSRLSSALVVALALHGLLLLVRTRPTQPGASKTSRGAAAELYEVESSAELPAQPTAMLSDAQREARPGSLGSARPPRGTARAQPRQSPGSADAELGEPVSGAEDGEPSAPASAGGTEPPGSAPSQRKIDLGLDGHFFMRPPSEDLPRIRKPEFQRQLENSLLTADVQRGLARGNALLGSLNSAVRAEGPTRGEALFRVTVGADGGLTSVEVVQGSAGDWSAVLSAFRELAARKRVRVPPGARGLRVTFSVKAKVQRPSGKEVQGAPIGVAEPSLAPNGLTLHGDFDVADLGSGGQRLVYARVVSEDLL